MSQADAVQVLLPRLRRVQWAALVVGAVGLVLCAIGVAIGARTFFRAYLFAYFFWLQIALGCILIVMTHHLSGGDWGYAIRRLLETGGMTLPLMALLFIPLLFGLPDLYAWAQPAAVASDVLLQHKQPFLNVPFFIGRAVFYFVTWIGTALLLNRWSLAQDREPDAARGLARRLRRFSAIALLVYCVTATFSGIDWVMSVEASWYSSVYGMILITGQGLVGLAFAIVALALVLRAAPGLPLATPRRFNDLGSLLLAVLIGWAYMAFSQLLIIWSGNLPSETSWYLHRSVAGWKWVAIVVALFGFAFPFAILIFHRVRSGARLLTAMAIWLVVVHLIEIFWFVVPGFYQTGFHLDWLDVVATLGIGGFWVAVFTWQLAGKPLVPLHDPRLPEGMRGG